MAYVAHITVMLAIYGSLALALDLVVSQLGVLLLCHSAFYAVGGYAAALLMLHADVPFALAAVASAVAASVVSLPMAFAARRLRQDSVVLASVAVLMILLELFENLSSVTGGLNGLPGIPAPSLGPYVLRGQTAFLPLAGLMLALAWLLTRREIESPLGRSLRAYRDDYVSAIGVGIQPLRIMVLAFVPAAAIAGLAGAVYAAFSSYVSPALCSLDQSILLLTMVLLGGAGVRAGPLVGAAILVGIPEAFRLAGLSTPIVGALRQIVFGVCLLFFSVVRPRGLLGGYRFR